MVTPKFKKAQLVKFKNNVNEVFTGLIVDDPIIHEGERFYDGYVDYPVFFGFKFNKCNDTFRYIREDMVLSVVNNGFQSFDDIVLNYLETESGQNLKEAILEKYSK